VRFWLFSRLFMAVLWRNNRENVERLNRVLNV
jgi:hypothetical protein